MSDAIITVVLTQLATIMEREIRQEVRLVVGVEKDIDKLTRTLQAIVHVLIDADKRQIKEEAVKDWLEKLKDASYDVDDLLDEWNTAILKQEIARIENPPIPKKKKVFSFIKFPCFCFNQLALRHDIGIKIKDLNERLDMIAIEKDRYKFNVTMAGEEPERLKTISFKDVKEVRGRDQDKNTLVSKLLSDSSQGGDRSLNIISVVGMGGIGKTTLAQLAYHCDEVKAHFDIRIWVCVSEPFDEIRIAKAIFEDIVGCAPNNFELNTILGRVGDKIVGKKFLLVLDDVWTEDFKKWEPFKDSLTTGARGSKILVTTRNERVAIMMETTDILPLRQLSDEDCWFLFKKIAFSGRSRDEKLEEIGRKIAYKCKGLPLAAKTIGSLMRFKNTLHEWQNVLDSGTWELEEAEQGLFPPLLLSYYDLTSKMKRCFSFCAIFPKDHKIEADNLIKLWMAHGYLRSRESWETVDMEITGREYLQNLAMRSFFQDLEKDKNGDCIIRFKMHDMVHDFAKFLTKNEFFIMEVKSGTELKMDSICKDARHSTLVRVEEAPFPTPICNTEKLQSFWVQSFYDSPPIVSEIDIVPPDSFSHLKCLKSLDLSRNRLDKLPLEVGELIKLRYLNLSHNPLSELPDTVCDLCNLQTLKLVACDQLRRLPQGMWKLMYLRHLEIDRTDRLRMLPKGIGRLKFLRTLTKFVIGGGGDSEEATCKIAELKNLNFLQGHLKIEGLGYVADAGEVDEAELKNKKDLLGLHVDFNPPMPGGATDFVEALQLHPNLQYLQMRFYVGTQFPNWMMSLTNLRELHLQECQNCVGLPHLGKLPSLEKLYIKGMQNLKYVSLELLGRGIGNDNHNGCSTLMHGGMAASSSSAIILFPKLKKLKIGWMNSWEEWDEISARGEAEERIKIMPCLRCLKLSHCNKLKALPNRLLRMASLKKLCIHNCPILQQRYQKEIGEDWTKISHIRKVRIS